MIKKTKIDSIIYKISPVIFALCVAITAFFSCWFLSVREPIGDDVMGHFDKAISFYLDEMEDTLGEPITTFGQSIKTVGLIYSKWSGRLLGYFFNELSGVLSDEIKAYIGTSVLLSNVLVILILAYGSTREMVQHPLIYMIIFLAMYWYRPLGFYEYMWTMITIYEIPLLVSLVYCKYMLREGEKNGVFAVMLGLMAGISNEICVVMLISILGSDWLYKVCTKKTAFKSILNYMGLFVGGIINILSPGNINRMSQSHDSTMHTRLIAPRMKDSADAHRVMLIPGDICLKILVFALILVTLVFFAYFVKKRGKAGLFLILINLYQYIIAGIISVITWGLMSRTPAYGLSFWMALFYISLIKLFHIVVPKTESPILWVRRCSVVFGMALLFYFVIGNYNWMLNHAKIANERRDRIERAVCQGKKEVSVPRFKDDSLGPITEQKCLNEKDQYDSIYYIKYYSIHIIVE